ncbi:MAG: DHA2 family efflux MFS transporter permease subunit [Alphaproteobacteria bacterium]
MTQAAVPAPRASLRGIAVMVSVILAGTVYEINITIATVALPHMQGTFAATHDQISWVVTSFVLGMTMVLACSGWLADRFGRKRVFLVGTIGFTLASLLCGTATSVEEAVLWRLLQGGFGAPLMPISQAMTLDAFPKEQHGTANTIWGIATMIGPAMGPTIGGLLVEHHSWPWTFYFGVPFGAVAALGVWLLVREEPHRADRPMDWLGFATLIIVVGMLQFILNRGERLDWFESTEIIVATALTAASLYVFVVHSALVRHPFLEPAMFRDRNFVIGLSLTFVWGFVLHGNIVLVSLMLQELRGFPVVTLGMVMSPRGIGVMAGMVIGNFLLKRMDPRLILAGGFGMIATSSWAMSGWTNDVEGIDVLWTGFLQGTGTGMGFIPLFAMMFATLDGRHRTEGITMFNLVLFTGISCGIAVAVSVLTRSANINHATLVEHISRYNDLLSQPRAAGAWDMVTRGGLASIEAEVTRQATMIGYLNNFTFIAILSATAIPFVLLFRRPRDGATAAGMH